jgi:hypothetical protein
MGQEGDGTREREGEGKSRKMRDDGGREGTRDGGLTDCSAHLTLAANGRLQFGPAA